MKPAWLNKKIDLGACASMKSLLRSAGLNTVCEQALCPNIGECFGRGEAAFLILGKNCTRGCSFCNIEKGSPMPVDPDEPARVAEAVEKLSLRHAVVTSVTRDDLEDGGAGAFAATVSAIRRRRLRVTIEILMPDFKLSQEALKTVMDSCPDIIAHNVETVPFLYQAVRRGSDYLRSLGVLRALKDMSGSIRTKSGIMLGMGEVDEEVRSVMRDLRQVECDFLSIGQYLSPSRGHFPVKEHIPPGKFDFYKEMGMAMGFRHIESGPYVRSSYMASRYLSV